MVGRKLNVKLYLFALIITIIVFLLGVYVGGLVNSQVSSDLMQQIEYYSQSTQSLDIILLLNNSASFCPFYITEKNTLETETLRLGEELTYLEEIKGVFNNDLKRNYFILEAKSYLYSKKVSDICSLENNFILYFYSKDCKDCIAQGKELDNLQSYFNGDVKLRIYSFDGELNSPIVEGFKKEYNITNYPTLIINGKKTDGFKNKNDLINLMQVER